MQRKSFKDMPCPIARSLEQVGEWWSILILRDAFAGMTRFDEFQKSLGIAPNILTRRLNGLVESGLLIKQQYSEKPPRFEYKLTDRGKDFKPIMLSLLAWGNKHFSPEGTSVMLVDIETGLEVEPTLIDAVTGKVISDKSHRTVAGPAAGEIVHNRMAARSLRIGV